jgi:hypothetical protein
VRLCVHFWETCRLHHLLWKWRQEVPAKCCYRCDTSRPQTQFSQMFKHQMSQTLFNHGDYSTQQYYELIRNYMIHILLGLLVRILPGAWMSVSCKCCVLLGRSICIGTVTRPEESYQVWCVWVWSWSVGNKEALAQQGLLHHGGEMCSQSSNHSMYQT